MEKEIVALLYGASPLVLVLFYFLLFPEKVEKWSALIWRGLNACGGFLKFAHKRYLKHDLQGRVNDFVRGLRKRIPEIGDEKLKIEWIDPNVDRESFIADGSVVLRLRRDDPQDHNFVHGAYHYVSGAFLRKAKRYLSENQRGAIDIFVCLKLLESEKPSVVVYFLDQYAHPQATKPKIRELLDKFEILHRVGYYFPVFLQELHILGDKIFGKLKKASIEAEVTALVNFLEKVVNRKVGEEIDLNFEGTYCKVGVVIVGKAGTVHLEGSKPYVRYLSKLGSGNIDTIYMVSPIYNKEFVIGICDQVKNTYTVLRKDSFVGRIIVKGETKRAEQFLVVLRRIGATTIQTHEDVAN